MSTVRYFRHDDAGAPALSGQVGALANVLRKCLVGVGGVAYGAKASAGWSEAFAGTGVNVAVFRNNVADGASGAFFRLDDNNAQYSYMAPYSAMSDINTGTNALTSRGFRKSATSDGQARPWLVVADGKTAWVYVWLNGAGGTDARDASLIGFGDYWSVANTSLRYFVAGKSSQSHATGYHTFFQNHTTDAYLGNGGLLVPQQSGVGAEVQAIIQMPHYNNTTGAAACGGSLSPARPHPVTGALYFSADPAIRVPLGALLGRLRGVSLPHQDMTGLPMGTGLADAPTLVRCAALTQNGVGTSYQGCFLIDTVGPWL